MFDYSKVINSEKILNFFGNWPSFHDAEVVSLVLDRRDTSLQIVLHTIWIGANNIKKSAEVEIKFISVQEDIELFGFNHQNVLFGIDFIQKENSTIAVDLKPIFGLEGRFSCRSVEIVSVRET